MEQTDMRVMISGGFDPIHVGHVRYIREALLYCDEKGDELLVVVNGDDWLIRKKGKAFMSQKDRVEILGSMVRPQDRVVIWNSITDHIAGAIEFYKPDIFAKGGDRDLETLPIEEIYACVRIGCKIITRIGGEKVRSSSELLKKYGE